MEAKSATPGGIQEKWFLTEDGLYEVCMQSHKPIAKELNKEIKKYLKQIRITGGSVEQGHESVDIVKNKLAEYDYGDNICQAYEMSFEMV